jgi:hypothetical protein
MNREKLAKQYQIGGDYGKKSSDSHWGDCGVIAGIAIGCGAASELFSNFPRV